MVIHTKGSPQTALQLSWKIIKIDSCEVPKIMKEAMYAACLGEICKRGLLRIWRKINTTNLPDPSTRRSSSTRPFTLSLNNFCKDFLWNNIPSTFISSKYIHSNAQCTKKVKAAVCTDEPA
jgi:hypothetical protein